MAVTDGNGWEQPTPPVIETASATTSTDNANSGNLAFVLAAVAIASLAVIGMGMSSIFQLAGHLVEEHETSYWYDDPDGYQFDLNDNTGDPYDLIEEYLDGPNDYDDLSFLTNKDKELVLDQDKDGKVTPTEALGADLGMYEATIDSLLPQSSYANAQADVRSFVRDLVLADRNATSEMASSLQQTAWKEGDVKQELEKASALADKTIEELQAMKAPAAQGDKAKDISKSLEAGKSKAIDRWKAIADELKLIASADELDGNEVKKADELTGSTAQEAADALEQAMTDSAKR